MSTVYHKLYNVSGREILWSTEFYMPSEAYTTVTLRRDVVKKLDKLKSTKSTSALISEAIDAYVEANAPKPIRRHELDISNMTSGTTSTLIQRQT